MPNIRKASTIKFLIAFAMALFIILYPFFTSGEYLTNLINTSFILGLALLTFSGALAVFYSGSLNLFLAGFSKKIKNDLKDKLRVTERKTKNQMNKEALDFYDSQEKTTKRRIAFYVRFPLMLGLLFVIISFIILFLF